jgi:hypothetical protein
MFGLIFGITFAIGGLVAIMVGRSMSETDREIASWPRAPGTITSSQIENVETTIKDYRGMYQRATTPTPIVRFTYTVNDRELKGDQISRFGKAFTPQPLVRYPLGTAVSVYYDPDAPTTAYLEAPVSPGAKIFSIIGYVFVVLGVAAPLVQKLL